MERLMINNLKYKIYEPTFNRINNAEDAQFFDSEEAKAAAKAVNSGWLSHGPECNKFEESLSVKFNCNAYSCNTGTAALHLALIAAGIKAGDEVIVPATTFVATANAVVYCGAKPVFVDVDPITWNIDPSKIAEKINEKTRAIVPCHLYGSPSDLDAIQAVINNSGHNIVIVNDACEALGATYKGRELFEYGISSYSLFGNKTITCGEGGFILSKEKRDDIPYFRGHCHEGEYIHGDIGFNYRMNNISAAVARVQLKYLQQRINYKQFIFSSYNSMLKKSIQKQGVLPYAKHGYWMYAIRVESAKQLKQDLAKHGIETRRCFKPINEMKPYLDNYIYPVANELRYSALCLPSHCNLSLSDIHTISQRVNELI